MSREQKMLCLRIDNTRGNETREALKQERNRLQQPSGKKTLENAYVKLDQVQTGPGSRWSQSNDVMMVLRCLGLSGAYISNRTSNPQ